MESRRREKFVELANKRVNRVLKELELIGNLANRASYDYTDRDVGQIFREIRKKVAACQKRFQRPPKARDENQFVLKAE